MPRVRPMKMPKARHMKRLKTSGISSCETIWMATPVANNSPMARCSHSPKPKMNVGIRMKMPTIAEMIRPVRKAKNREAVWNGSRRQVSGQAIRFPKKM